MKKSSIGDLVASNMLSVMKSDEYTALFGKQKLSKASLGDESFEDENPEGTIEVDGDLDVSDVDSTGLDEMVHSYMETALWSTNGEDGDKLGSKYDISDIDEITQRQMREDCKELLAQCQDCIGDKFDNAGYAFWLARNGHGAGFGDGDWEPKDEKRLDRLSRDFGSFDLLEDGEGHVCSTISNYYNNKAAENDEGLDEDDVLKESSKLLNQLLRTSKRLDKSGFSKSAELVLKAAESVIGRMNKIARNGTDVVGYADTIAGEVYCPDCVGDPDKEDMYPIFESDEGASDEHCNGCGEALDSNWSDEPYDDNDESHNPNDDDAEDWINEGPDDEQLAEEMDESQGDADTEADIEHDRIQKIIDGE